MIIPSRTHAQTSYFGFVPSNLMSRQSTKSRIVFDMFNDGTLFGTMAASDWDLLMWPRETFEQTYYAQNYEGYMGLWFGTRKKGRPLVSGSAMATTVWPQDHYPAYPTLKTFNQFVPGFIGDPQASSDTAFGGVGWRYVDDPNHILYLSTDYDSSGVDATGNNLPDWPVRVVAGREAYVQQPQLRHLYPPVFKSDEEFFSIFKDTDTRSDPEYQGAHPTTDTASTPIGIEVRQYCYTWSTTLLRDAIVLVFEIHNKSGVRLDSCFAGPSLAIVSNSGGRSSHSTNYFAFDDSRQLGQSYNDPVAPNSANPFGLDGRVGYSVIDSPNDIHGVSSGLTFWKRPPYAALLCDSVRYEWFTHVPMRDSLPWNAEVYSDRPTSIDYLVLFGTGPFTLLPGDSARIAVGICCAIGYDELVRLHNFVKTVYTNNLKKPSPPTLSTLSATATEGSVLLRWDDSAERSIDGSVPDSLGKPFAGYRLYRSRGEGSPYVLIREWKAGRDSLVHEYLDHGQDGKDATILVAGGLVQNIPYTYKLTAFDEAVPSLEIPEMENAGSVAQATASATPASPYALDDVRIVPNPYIVEHAAQKTIDAPKLFFNFLPEVCTIRIYTVALDLVAELHHSGGSAESWDLKAQGGQQVASQMFLAVIETPQGTRVTKKFAVVAAE
jgi:hypothetical protein